MANLIIKPQNVSGDKVIIQDQAGGAVLTTADSGVTIANATLVAPALGTPASGVLTNATFPAGHVTKVHHHPLAADVSAGGSIATYTYQTVVISPSSGTSKLYAFHSMHYKQGSGGGANFYHVLEISGSNVSNITHTGTLGYQMASQVWDYRVVSFVYGEVLLDGTASDVTFVFRVTHGHGNNTTDVAGNNANETATTIIEVY